MTYPVVKSGCGVFAVLRWSEAEAIDFPWALRGIESIRFRGSPFGAGFASATLGEGRAFTLKAYVDGPDRVGLIREELSLRAGLALKGEEFLSTLGGGSQRVWTGHVEARHEDLWRAVVAINEKLSRGGFQGRLYSYGRYLTVYKGVGHPLDVARQTGLLENGPKADLWLAHTRQPTNSPGFLPIWSHPFACFDWAIVHNGDVSSFGSNVEFLRSRGVDGFVGTDSEVIAYLLDQLTRIEGLAVEEAALLLSRPYERALADLDPRLRPLLRAFKGAALDGPFSVLCGYCDGEDVYLLGLLDKTKLRPLVIGEDGDRIYAASEECAIRAVAPKARVYAPEPGRFFLASMKQGILEPGRHHLNCYRTSSGASPRIDGTVLDASGMESVDLNHKVLEAFGRSKEVTLLNVNGQRYIGVKAPRGTRLVVHGTPGNCLANYNEGAEIIVHGNAEDDVGDVMQDGRVVIHGDARDVLGQALQGGEILVKGNAGNRAGIQMREYQDRKPFLVIGNKADDYFGEYMAGGVAMALGLRSLANGCACPAVGRYVGTGMVGGRIYIRGRVPPSWVGLSPPTPDLLAYLEGLRDEGLVSQEQYDVCSRCEELSYRSLAAVLNPEALERIRVLYMGKGNLNLSVDYGRLTEQDLEFVGPRLTSFFREFDLDRDLYEKLLASEFTVISVRRS